MLSARSTRCGSFTSRPLGRGAELPYRSREDVGACLVVVEPFEVKDQLLIGWFGRMV